MTFIRMSFGELYTTCLSAQSDSIRNLVLVERACSQRIGMMSAEMIAWLIVLGCNPVKRK